MEHLILNQVQVRQNPQQKLMFNSFGLSIFDLALAHIVVGKTQDQSGVPQFELFKER
ncbi:hypothetical protein [Paenibacillus caui]|uniref:hypothetical protein n=1 Tax=Paenibacillus caui TaxID=2873927 RepID=UPI001CA9C354|nr:hypothetical protein [Paenibacillus caui]